MFRNLFLASLVLTGLSVAAVEVDSNELWNQCGETVIPSCREYVAAFCDSKEVTKWNKKMDDRIQQKVADSNSDEDSALQTIALDWATDNRKALEKHERESIKQACMLFLRFWDRKIPPPGQIRERMTLKNAKELAEFLNDETKGKKEHVEPPKTPQTVAVPIAEKP